MFLSTFTCASLCTSLTTRTNFQLNQIKYRLCIQVFLSCPAFRIEFLTQNVSPFDGQSLSVCHMSETPLILNNRGGQTGQNKIHNLRELWLTFAWQSYASFSPLCTASRGRQPSEPFCPNPSHQPRWCPWPEPKRTSTSLIPPAGTDAACRPCCPGSQAADQTWWWAEEEKPSRILIGHLSWFRPFLQ